MLRLPLGPEDWLEDVVRDFPKAPTFLRRQGIVCIKCGEPLWGSLKEIIESKGKDVDEVLAALNEFLAKDQD